MSGRGDRPEDGGERRAEETVESVALGEKLFDGDGKYLGRVRGCEEGGFFVTTRDGMERLSIEHARSGHDFGAAHLVWRCTNCGEIDDGHPECCPDCGTEKEELMWWTAD